MVPPMQRRPSPNETGATSPVPCRKKLEVVGSCPEDVSTIVSGATDPVATSTAPPVATELSQPCPESPELPHGHATADAASPKQKGVIAEFVTERLPLGS